jgi:hypothetical protein
VVLGSNPEWDVGYSEILRPFGLDGVVFLTSHRPFLTIPLQFSTQYVL